MQTRPVPGVCGDHGRPWPCKTCVLKELLTPVSSFWAQQAGEDMVRLLALAPLDDFVRFHREVTAWRLRQESITCPVCFMRSPHPRDRETGWCANCSAYTGDLLSLIKFLE